MANHKSAEKRQRQSVKRRSRNRNAKSAIRTLEKKTRLAAGAKDAKTATELAKETEKMLASAAKKGIMNKKTAARHISKIASLAAKIAKSK